MPVDLFATHSLWLAVTAALLPALLGAWWSRSRPSDPSVLAEWNLHLGQRLSVTMLLCTVVVFTVMGPSGWWLLGVELAGLAAVRHRLRRALFGESWPFSRYLAWKVRVGVAALGFWIFIALAPARVGASPPDTAWAWALGCAAAGVLWLHFHRGLVVRLLGATPLTRPDLDVAFREVFERSTIARPTVWRAGVAGGVLANALAVPSVHGHGVLFFDTLLERLTPEETTAILAHEVAHLEYFDTRVWRMHVVSVGATIGVLAVATWIATRDPDLAWLMTGLWPLLALGALYLRTSRMRAHETASDLRAVELCGNPEALVSGLTRLYAINHMPRRLATHTEETATHPSLARRIRDIRTHAGLVDPVTLESPTVVASSEPGRFAILEATGISLLWSDAEASGSVETLRTRARRVESTAYADLVELRLQTTAAGVVLTAVDREGHRSTLPLSPPDATRVQRVLDVVDQRVPTPRPGSGSVLDRMIAGLVLGLGATLTGFAGLVPAILLLLRPSRRLLCALALSLLGTTVVVLPRGLAGQIVAVVLLTLALGVAWRAVRASAAQPASRRRQQLELAGLVLPVIAAGGATLVSGGHLYDLHVLLREQAWIAGSLLALVGYLASSPGRTPRGWAAGVAVVAVGAVWCASPWFVSTVGADPLIVAGPLLRERHVPLHPVGHLLVDGTFQSVRLSPDGGTFLLTDAPDHYPDEAGLRPRDFVVGSADGWSREIRVVDAQLVDDDRLLVLEHSRGDSLLRLETSDDAVTTWSLTVPDMLARELTVARDGRWRLDRDSPDGITWVEGRLDEASFRRLEWSPESDELGVPIAYLIGDAPFALTVDFDRVLGSLPWPSRTAHARTSLLAGAAGHLDVLARSHLLVDCLDAPSVAAGPLVCTAHDGRDSYVWSVDLAGHRLVPVGRWRGYLYGWEYDGTGAIDVDANGLPARLDPQSATLDRLDAGDADCPFVSGHALAGRRLATICAREASSDVLLYDLPD